MSLRKYFKRLGRKSAKVHKVVNRVITPAVAAGAGFFGGPAAAAAVTAGGAELGRYFRATEARNAGQYSRARALGRGERARVWTYGGIAGGAGSLGAGVTTLAAGGTFGQAVGSTFLGVGGHALVGGGSILTPGTLGSAKPAALLGASVPTVDPAHTGLTWQTINGVPVYAPATAGGSPMMGLSGLTPTGQLAAINPATGILGTGLTWGEVGTGALGLGGTVLNRMYPTGGVINEKPDGNFVTHDDLADIMAGIFGGNGGGNGGDGDGSGRNISDSKDGGGSLLPLLLIGGLLFAAS